MSNGASFSNQWKNESILSGCVAESNFTRVSLEFVQPISNLLKVLFHENIYELFLILSIIV